MVTDRMKQFDELIKRETSLILQEFFTDKIFSITQLHVSKDLSFAKVWISSFREVDGLVKSFQEKSKEIRKELSKRVIARRVPSLYFVADKTEEEASKIEKLLSDIKVKK